MNKQTEFWDAILSGLSNTYRRDARVLIENQLVHLGELDYNVDVISKLQSMCTIAVRKVFPLKFPDDDFFLYDFFDVDVVDDGAINMDELTSYAYMDLDIAMIERVLSDDLDELSDEADTICETVKDAIFNVFLAKMKNLAEKNKIEVFKYDHWFHRNKKEKQKAGYLYKTIISMFNAFDGDEKFIIAPPNMVDFLMTLDVFEDDNTQKCEYDFYCGSIEGVFVYMAPPIGEDYILIGCTDNGITFHPCTLMYLDDDTEQLNLLYDFTIESKAYKNFGFIDVKNFTL